MDPEHGEVDIARFYWTVDLSHLGYRILVAAPEETTLPAPADADDELAEALGLGMEAFAMDEGEVVQVMHRGPFANED